MSSGSAGYDPVRPDPIPPKPGSGSGGGDGNGGSDDPCNITERTRVNSPDKTVKATIRDGDLLTVQFESGPPKRLLVRTSAGQVLGSITSQSMAQIIACIGAGHQYVAIVLSTAGGIVEVQVQRA